MPNFTCDCPDRPLAHHHDCPIARAEKAEREWDHAVTAGKRMASMYEPVRDERDALRARAERLAGLLREAVPLVGHVCFEPGVYCEACISIKHRADAALAEGREP